MTTNEKARFPEFDSFEFWTSWKETVMSLNPVMRIDDDSLFVSVRQGSKMLYSERSPYQVSSLVKAGVIRINSKKQVYTEDIKLLQVYIKAKLSLVNSGIMKRDKNYKNKNIVMIYEPDHSTQNIMEFEGDKDIQAILYLYDTPFFQELHRRFSEKMKNKPARK
jgi:hypothetical protein